MNYLDIFHQLNHIPRPSHHEGPVADFLCQFAEDHGLKYRRDAQNCVVIEKPATPGYESAEPIVILNHMDMVCVAQDGYLRDGRPFNPLTDDIRSYVETDENGTRWMKAEGTSLGADNGIGLSMALAILTDDSLVHPAIEVLTTTNEEDGMSGAEGLSNDFIHGRKVINLDSEAYNEITVGAAGACLQEGKWDLVFKPVPAGYAFKKILISGGLGGHSGVDINKGRCNCNHELFELIDQDLFDGNDELGPIYICHMKGGTANASIASWAEAVVALPANSTDPLQGIVTEWDSQIKAKYEKTDPAISICLTDCEPMTHYIENAYNIVNCIAHLPYGVQRMRPDMPGTVMTSNNIGMVSIDGNTITVSCHTRSFDNAEQTRLSSTIRQMMLNEQSTDVKMLMNTGAWLEREDSPLLALTCRTFKDVLGFEPKKVAMHFVLEAAYYVEKYPGIEIASIGPLIIEPHSTSERVNLDTADNIWRVTIELLRRLASYE